MSRFDDSERAIALGGIFQGARLARDLARNGQTDPAAMNASIGSLFVFDPEEVAGVFGGVSGIQFGLRTLLAQLESPHERDLEIARYAVSLIHLADKLRNDPQALDRLGDDLNAMQNRSNGFELSESTRAAQLGELYRRHVSVISPQIMVRGEPVYLQNTDNAARIRAALLAGIRAAILWRQCGGAKWQLMLRRSQIARLARNLLDRAVS